MYFEKYPFSLQLIIQTFEIDDEDINQSFSFVKYFEYKRIFFLYLIDLHKSRRFL